jgi:serine protease
MGTQPKTLVLVVALALVTVTVPIALAGNASNGSGSQLYNVGVQDGDAFDRGDEFHGATVLSANDAIDFVNVRADDPADFEQRASQDDDVRYLEEDRRDALEPHYTPNDPQISDQWGWGASPGIDAYTAWDTTLGSTDVMVGVLDSGLEKSHEDIGNYLQGYDFANDDNDPEDKCGHGTHVAGTVGALTDNGVGVAGTAQAQILPVKVLDKGMFGSCTGSFADVADGITYATDQGADVIQMSLGCTDCSDSSVKEALQYAWDNGVLTVASAGNDGECTDCVGFPANDGNAMAISAYNSDGNFASYSSQGPEVELTAPGSNILSTYEGNDYAYLDGTSMAAPHVSGTAALVLDVTDLTNGELRTHLKDTATDMGFSDNRQGAGSVDAADAVSGFDGGGPTADFTSDCTELNCTFDGSSSTGDIQSYDWEFGDGTTGTGEVANHTYAAGGTYTVNLTVTNATGATDTTSDTVTVSSGGDAAMHVHDVVHDEGTGPPGQKDLISTVTVYDANEDPVADVDTCVEITRDSDGATYTDCGLTDGNGEVTFRWSDAGRDTYTTCVTDLTKDGYSWDTSADHASDGNCHTA